MRISSEPAAPGPAGARRKEASAAGTAFGLLVGGLAAVVVLARVARAVRQTTADRRTAERAGAAPADRPRATPRSPAPRDLASDDAALHGASLHGTASLEVSPWRAVGGALAIAVAAAVVPSRLKQAIAENAAREQDDFAIFHRTASALFGGKEAPYAANGGPPNLIPPHAHVMFAPLMSLSRPAAYRTWLGATTVALAAAGVLTTRALPVRSRPRAVALGTVLAAGSGLTMATVVSGQIYGVLTLPLTLAWLASRRGRHGRAGLIVGMLASAKPNLALLLVGWARQRNWRALGGGMLGVAVSLTLGVARFGRAPYLQWLQAIRGMKHAGHFRDGALLQTIVRSCHGNGHFQPLMKTSRENIRTSWLLASALLSGLTLLRPSRDPDRWWLRLLALSFLISPKGWVYAAWWLPGPALAVALKGGRRSRTLLGLAALALWLPDRLPKWGQPRASLTPWLGSLYFWTWLSVWLATFDARASMPPAGRLSGRRAVKALPPHRPEPPARWAAHPPGRRLKGSSLTLIREL